MITTIIKKSKQYIEQTIPPFWLTILVYLFMVYGISSHFINRMAICLAVILCNILYVKRLDAPPSYVYLISYSFLLYFALQSPILPVTYKAFEIAYFIGKIAFFVGLFCIYRVFPRYRLVIPILILLAFYIDSVFIHKINLGIAKSLTEYFSIWESLVALLSTYYLLSFIYQGQQRHEIISYLLLLFFVAHIANYFAAGFAKTMLDGGVFSWLENPTFSTLKRATLWGLNVLPSEVLESPLIPVVEYIGNIIVLTGQLASLLVIALPQLVGPITLFYDFFHLGVAALAGVWFYKWIFVNIIIYIYRKDIVAAIHHLTLSKKLALTLVIPLFYVISSVPHLGWYENYQGSLIYAYGVKENGERDRLHPQYFGSAGFSILDKNTHYAFKSSYPRQMASQAIAKLEKSRECNLTRILSPDSSRHLNDLTEITKRVLDKDRSYFSKLMIRIQPFHILIPSTTFNNSILHGDYTAIEFHNIHVCLDEEYAIKIHETDDILRILR